MKNSGIGRTHGRLGFAEMTQPVCLVKDIMPGVKKNFWWHPHGRAVYNGAAGILKLLYGPGLGRRLAGAFGLLRAFPRTFSK